MKGIVANSNIAPHVKESVLAYQENDMLDMFFTTFYEHSKYPLTQVLGKIFPSLKKEFRRRSFEELPYEKIRGYPFKELLRVFAARKLDPVLTDKIWEWGEHSYDRWVANQLYPDLDFAHVTENACLQTLERAKKLNIPAFYEQPSIHHQTFTTIFKIQHELYPIFKQNKMTLVHEEHGERRNKRRDDELKLADYIICNSSFTKTSLLAAGVDSNKILTVPLGFPLVVNEETVVKKINGPLIFLYAGNLSLGKGTHILLDTWKKLNFPPNKAVLWLVGKNHLPETFTHSLGNNVIFFGNIPRADLMDLYTKAHAFVLPTLADGFGMVITEAMSRGLPVIATQNCAGPDLITSGQDGLIIPANDQNALAETLNWCIMNPIRLAEMGIEAKNRAKKYSWAEYRKNLVNTVKAKLRSNDQ